MSGAVFYIIIATEKHGKNGNFYLILNLEMSIIEMNFDLTLSQGFHVWSRQNIDFPNVELPFALHNDGTYDYLIFGATVTGFDSNLVYRKGMVF